MKHFFNLMLAGGFIVSVVLGLLKLGARLLGSG
jgi:hypothetical protein